MQSAYRQVKYITIKRNHIDLSGDDKYGHWWFEFGDPIDPDSESYGWWPASPVNLSGTFTGVLGELNGISMFNGEHNRDPHHGDYADQEFHPFVDAADTRTDLEIADCLRGFANAYSGEWRWTFGSGQNCHTFQRAAMIHCKIIDNPLVKRKGKTA